jgi:hypothetical protein
VWDLLFYNRKAKIGTKKEAGEYPASSPKITHACFI